MDVPELPFPVVASPAEAWRRDGPDDSVVAEAAGCTDYYVDPAGGDAAAAKADAATLLGLPSSGDLRLSAAVTVDFRSTFDAGVLMVLSDERTWAKLCFELSPAGEAMVVSVVTRGVSDDANAFVVDGRTVRLRISRTGAVYAFHASTDGGDRWQLVRVFTLGPDVATHRIGLEAQSPTGPGCRVEFASVRFTTEPLQDLRDGS